jgi:hypothetical protein
MWPLEPDLVGDLSSNLEMRTANQRPLSLYTLRRINNDRCWLSCLSKIAHMQRLRFRSARERLKSPKLRLQKVFNFAQISREQSFRFSLGLRAETVSKQRVIVLNSSGEGVGIAALGQIKEATQVASLFLSLTSVFTLLYCGPWLRESSRCRH